MSVLIISSNIFMVNIHLYLIEKYTTRHACISFQGFNEFIVYYIHNHELIEFRIIRLEIYLEGN